MSKEREFQPDINTQYLLDQVSRLTAENAMLKEKWLSQSEQEPVAWYYIYDDGITVRERVTQCMPLGEHYTITPLYTTPPKREPLTSKLISLGNNCHESFIKGVRFAEKMHGIGVNDE